jgi:uncharacterized protein (DUF2141 family)
MNRQRWPSSAHGWLAASHDPDRHRAIALRQPALEPRRLSFHAARLQLAPIFRVSSQRRPARPGFPYSGLHRTSPLEKTMNHLLKTALFSAAVLSSHLASAADLTIVVDDVKAAGGSLMVALYDSADSFLQKPARASGQPAAASGNQIVFKDLPEGDYAFALYHDANANGKLDRNLVGIPTEDYAFSNNALGKMGPPNFEMAKFTIPAAGATVRVTLK